MSRLAGWSRSRASAFAPLLVSLMTGASPRVRHLTLKRSEPAQGSVLSIAPTRIALWFTARPELAFSRIRLAGQAGAIPLDTIVADSGNSLHATIQRALEPGGYRVEWQTASADGHPIRGEFAFTVVVATPGQVPARSVDSLSHAGHEQHMGSAKRDDSGSRTARWFEFVAVLTILGALGFRHGVLPPLAARGVPTADAADRSRRLGQSVLVLYVVAAVMRLYMQSRALNGANAAFDPGVLWPMITTSMWGIGWSAGVVGAALLFVGWVASGRSVVIGTPLALSGALGMVLAPAFSGHAAASRQFIFSVTLDMLHIAAAGLWVGGLAMVLFAGIPAMLRLADGNKHAAVSALVNSFHPLALFCAPIAVLSGFGSTWLRLGEFGALWSTQYGNTVLLKIACVVLVAVMGAYNSIRVRRQLGGADGDGTRRFRLTGAAETAFAAMVLIVTTFLVVTPVPSEMMSP